MIHSGPMAAATLATLGNLGFVFSAATLPADRGAIMDDIMDEVGAAFVPGEFVLSRSEVRKIYEGKMAHDFRICVKGKADTASMKVTFDAQSVMLVPGECRDVAGKTIQAAPAQGLTGAANIVATAREVKK
jgi:hypothetical protein